MTASDLFRPAPLHDGGYAGARCQILRHPNPKGIPADSGNQFGIKLSLPCYSFVDSVDLSATKSAADILAPINTPQDGPFAEFGSVSPLLYREHHLSQQGHVASARFLIHLTLTEQDAVVHSVTLGCCTTLFIRRATNSLRRQSVSLASCNSAPSRNPLIESPTFANSKFKRSCRIP